MLIALAVLLDVGADRLAQGVGRGLGAVAVQRAGRILVEAADLLHCSLVDADGHLLFRLQLEAGPGKARVISVPGGGPWALSDDVYGHVDGYLHSMRELVACASVTPSGKFRFDGVPPGPYSLRILRGAEQVAVRRVTVPAGKTLLVDPLSMSESGRK